jgi:hypothetical protein
MKSAELFFSKFKNMGQRPYASSAGRLARRPRWVSTCSGSSGQAQRLQRAALVATALVPAVARGSRRAQRRGRTNSWGGRQPSSWRTSVSARGSLHPPVRRVPAHRRPPHSGVPRSIGLLFPAALPLQRSSGVPLY